MYFKILDFVVTVTVRTSSKLEAHGMVLIHLPATKEAEYTLLMEQSSS